MDFEEIEVDDDLLAMLDTASAAAAPPASHHSSAPSSSPKSHAQTSDSPSKAAPATLAFRPGRWVPSSASTTSSAPAAPSAHHTPPAPIIIPNQAGLLTKESIGGATSLLLELSYGGKARIRVSVSAQLPVSVFARRSPFQPANIAQKPLITALNLPTFIKDAFAKTLAGQNSSLWDVSCEDPTWPSYEEKAIDLESRSSSTLAHWLFPTRVLAQLDSNLRRAVEEENQVQNIKSYDMRVSVKYTSLPEYVRKLIIECNNIYKEAELVASTTAPGASAISMKISKILPQHLMQTDLFRALKNYQVKGVEYAFCRKGRLLLADAPGLGKTLQAIAIACCYEENWPVLVICPSSVRAMWANEFERWVPGLSFCDISTNFTGKKTSLKAKVNVISYELLKSPKIIESVWSHDPRTNTQQHPFGVVICDECHLLKTFKSARTQAILPLVQKAKRAIMLSGTPATSRPSELHTQLAAVLPRVFQFFPSFGDRYCDPQPTRFGSGIDYSGASNTNELHLLLTEALMIRRQKSEVLATMPTKRRHQLLLDIPKETRNILVEMAKEMRKVGESLGNSSSKRGRKPKSKASAASDEAVEVGDSDLDLGSLKGKQRTLVLEMFQNAGRAKLPSAIAHLKNCLATESSDTKYLVFAHHIDVLDGFSHSLREQGIEFIRIDGRTSNTSRQPLVDHFQNSPECRVAILSILAAGVGITLTKASKVFFAELYWDPAALLQAEDRAHRYGQEKDVDVYYMIAKNSYDEKLWDAVDFKLSVLSAVLDAKKGQMSLDSVSKGSGQESSKAADSFIGYLLQKIDGFFERAEESHEKSVTRRKARDGTFFQDDPIPSYTDSNTTNTDMARKSPPFKSTSSSRALREPTISTSTSSAASSSNSISTANPSHSSIVDAILDSDEDEDSIEALLRNAPTKKIAPLPSSDDGPSFHYEPSHHQEKESSPTKPLPPVLISPAVEQKRLDKLARFAAD